MLMTIPSDFPTSLCLRRSRSRIEYGLVVTPPYHPDFWLDFYMDFMRILGYERGDKGGDVSLSNLVERAGRARDLPRSRAFA